MSSCMQASWKTPTIPVGPFVGRLLELEPVHQLGLGGRAGDRDRPGVRGVGEQRAQGDHELAAQVVAGREQLGAELAPAHVRLDAAHQDHVAVQVGGEATAMLGAGPGDPAVAVVVGADDRPVDLEVVELLGVDGADDPGVPDLHQVVDHCRRGVRGVVPALERGDHHRVHQVRRVLDLDHPLKPSRRQTRSPRRRYRSAISRWRGDFHVSRCHHAETGPVCGHRS